jgi:hypothetical protein
VRDDRGSSKGLGPISLGQYMFSAGQEADLPLALEWRGPC